MFLLEQTDKRNQSLKEIMLLSCSQIIEAPPTRTETSDQQWITSFAASESFYLLKGLFIFNATVSSSKAAHRHISGKRRMCLPPGHVSGSYKQDCLLYSRRISSVVHMVISSDSSSLLHFWCTGANAAHCSHCWKHFTVFPHYCPASVLLSILQQTMSAVFNLKHQFWQVGVFSKMQIKDANLLDTHFVHNGTWQTNQVFELRIWEMYQR